MSEELKAAQARIACLEGEIAKRDARIVELQRYEHAFNEWHDKTEWVQAESATLSAKYLGCHRADVMRSLIDDLRAELAACRVAVENCELFRARIVELESQYQRDVCGMNNEGDPIGGDPAGGYANDNARLRAELAALKEQEPIGWYTEDHLDDKSATTYSWTVAQRWVEKGWPVSPLYAAPVSEAKAQEIEDLRRRIVPVQQVSVPDERAAFEREDRYIVIKRSDMDRIPNQKVVHSFLGALGELSAHSVRIPQRKFLVIESDWPEYDPAWKLIQDRVQGRPILDATPAAPAADAGMVDMYRHLQTVTPYRFKKIQDASVTDGGDVLYFHKDRFDAALLDDMAANCAKESK